MKKCSIKVVTPSKFSPEEEMLLSAEIKSLLCKNVIQEYHHEEGEYISPTFLTLKYHGSFRMILNLKKLNEHMPYIHFKMEIGGNIPDGNFLGRNCLGGNFPGGILMRRNFPVGNFPGGIFVEPMGEPSRGKIILIKLRCAILICKVIDFSWIYCKNHAFFHNKKMEKYNEDA